MIAGLLLQRRAGVVRKTELSESRQFMELATRAGGIGLWVLRDDLDDAAGECR